MKDKIKHPYLNNKCDICKNCYYLDGDEARCCKINFGSSHIMCSQVYICATFEESVSHE